MLVLATLSLGTAQAQAEGVNVDRATARQADAAKKKFRAAKQAYDAQKLQQALQLFRDSYEIVKSPNSHLMIAKILAELGDNAQAYSEFEAVIAEATATTAPEKYAQTAEDARAQRQALAKKLGFVVVRSQSQVTIAGREIEPAQYNQPLAFEPGSLELKLVDAAGVVREQKLNLEPGGTTTIDVAPLPPDAAGAPAAAAGCEEPVSPAPQRGGMSQRALGLMLGGVGLAGAGLFVGFGLASRSKYDALEGSCPDGLCPGSLTDEASSGRTYKNIANVGFGLGVAGLALGSALVLTAPRGASSAPKAALFVGPRSAGLKGAF